MKRAQEFFFCFVFSNGLWAVSIRVGHIAQGGRNVRDLDSLGCLQSLTSFNPPAQFLVLVFLVFGFFLINKIFEA